VGIQPLANDHSGQKSILVTLLRLTAHTLPHGQNLPLGFA